MTDRIPIFFVIESLIESHIATLKCLHVIAMVAWMAGIFYLPRLFVYHWIWDFKTQPYSVFVTMERRLLTFIMAPAAILTFCTGILLSTRLGWPWPVYFWLKFLCANLMLVLHIAMIFFYKNFKSGEKPMSPLFFRIFNEIPTLLLIFIVFCVFFRPFS